VTELRFLARIAQEPTVLESHHVTGAWNFVLKVRLDNMRTLEQFLNSVIKSVADVQRTEILIVLSSPKEPGQFAFEPPRWAR
jgi:Lrp/AsnC family leucine-responsive transcriptional regulator